MSYPASSIFSIRSSTRSLSFPALSPEPVPSESITVTLPRSDSTTA